MAVIRFAPNLMHGFNVQSMPWVMRIYLLLLLLCVALIVGSLAFFLANPEALAADHPTRQVLALAMDSFKIVLGAVIGSLSMAASRQWGQLEVTEDKPIPQTTP